MKVGQKVRIMNDIFTHMGEIGTITRKYPEDKEYSCYEVTIPGQEHPWAYFDNELMLLENYENAVGNELCKNVELN